MKKILIALPFLLIGCLSGGTGSVETAITTEISGRVFAVRDGTEIGTPLPGVKVSLGVHKATSDQDGYWQIPLTSSPKEADLHFVRPGYAQYRNRYEPDEEGQFPFITSTLLPADVSRTISPEQGATIVIPSKDRKTSATLIIPAAALSITFPIRAEITLIRPESVTEANHFPGLYLAVPAADGNQPGLESFGVLDVAFYQDNNALDNVTLAKPAIIRYPLNASQAEEYSEGDTIPTWTLNDSSIWQEESVAVVRIIRGEKFAEFLATHFTPWNCDRRLLFACLNVQLSSNVSEGEKLFNQMTVAAVSTGWRSTVRINSLGRATLWAPRARLVNMSLSFAGNDIYGLNMAMPAVRTSTRGGVCTSVHHQINLQTGKLKVTVQNWDGTPLQNTRVSLPEVGLVKRPDSNGVVSFDRLVWSEQNPPKITLQASSPPEATELYFRPVTVVRDTKNQEVVLTAVVLERPPVLLGAYLDRSELPLAGWTHFKIIVKDNDDTIDWGAIGSVGEITGESTTSIRKGNFYVHTLEGYWGGVTGNTNGQLKIAAKDKMDTSVETTLSATWVNYPPIVDVEGPDEVERGDTACVKADGDDPEDAPLGTHWNIDGEEPEHSDKKHKIYGNKPACEHEECEEYSGEDVEYATVRDASNRIKFEDAPQGLGEDGNAETDLFVIRIQGEKSPVKVTTKVSTEEDHYTLERLGDSHLDELGFRTTWDKFADDTYYITVASGNNRHALSHVEFEFEHDVDQETDEDGDHKTVLRRSGIHEEDESDDEESTLCVETEEPGEIEIEVEIGEKEDSDHGNDGSHSAPEFRLLGTSLRQLLTTSVSKTIHVRDTRSPDTRIISGPPLVTDSRTATFDITATADWQLSYQCRLDYGPWNDCNAIQQYSNVSDGVHVLTVRAVDGSGNADSTPETWDWEVDASAPSGTILLSSALTNQTTVDALLSWHDSGDVTAVSLQGDLQAAGWISPASPITLELTPGDGLKIISYSLADRAGNIGGPFTAVVELDRSAPQVASVTLAGGASTVSNSTVSLLLTGLSTDAASFAVTGDVADNSWKTIVNLSSLDLSSGDGLKTMYVVIRDQAGNTSAALGRTISLDQTAPVLNWQQLPPAVTSATSATFAFDSAAGDLAGYGCALDSQGEASCASPVTHSGLGTGDHVFHVWTYDILGNRSPDNDAVWTIPGNWQTVNAGDEFTCGNRSAGGIWCWGDNNSGQLGDGSGLDRAAPTRVSSANSWSRLSSGSSHSCAVATDGTLWCWGDNSFGQLGNGTVQPTTAPVQAGSGSNWQTVAVAATHSCAIDTSAHLWCWGDNSSGQLGDGTNTTRSTPNPVAGNYADWSEVRAGNGFTCGIRGSTLWCWGNNNVGQTGTGNASLVPGQVTSLNNVSKIATGDNHACAILTSGALYCWGSNSFGKLGASQASQESLPLRIGTAFWQDVALGHDHSCAVRNDGTFWCWGSNVFGQLGQAAMRSTTTPVQQGNASSWVTVATGRNHSCGLQSSNTIWCWGWNSSGQLGGGNQANQFVPTQAATSTTLSAGSAGTLHTCALGVNGTLWCWGENGSGQLATGDFYNTRTPVQSGGLSTWATVASGDRYSCGIQNDSSGWCWGWNQYGQLGLGNNASAVTATAIAGGHNWITVTARKHHSCAIATDKNLWCWGRNQFGQLGSSSGDSNAPVQVPLGSNWQSVAVGAGHTCGILGGALWCWGDNSSGQLARGSFDAGGNTPVQVGTNTDWTLIKSGWNHSCGLRGTALYCWGLNSNGQLGAGSTSSRANPQSVPGSWTALALGGSHSCAIRSDGTLACWGANTFGQLGDNSIINRSTPVSVGNASDWISLFAGEQHSCGIRSNNSLWCWGYNGFGQLGDGSAWTNIPVQVATP